MTSLGFPELLITLVVLVFQLAPLALAIVAIVIASRLRKQVTALEQRVAQLETARPPAS